MPIEINKQYEMYELPELVKTLITSSRFVKSGDVAVRYASVSPSVDNVQQERAMNVTLHLALSQMSHVETTMIDADGGPTLNPSDVVVTARTLFGDNESVYLTITTNQTAELVAAMTVNWSTCTVTLYENSRRVDDKQPTQEKEKEMTVSAHEESLILIAKQMENFDYDHALTPVVVVGNTQSLLTVDLALKVIRTHTTFNTVKLVNLDEGERVTDKYAIVVSCERNGVVGVYHTSDTWVTHTQPLLSVNLNFINPQTTEKKEETMNKEPSFIDAVSTILTATDAALKRNDNKCIKQVLQVIWKPIFRNGKQIAQNHNVWNLLTQLREEFSNRNVTFVVQPEIYSTPTSSVFITIGSNKEDVLASDSQHPGEQVLVRVFENHQCIFEGWVDINPTEDNKFKLEPKVCDMRQNPAAYPVPHLTDKLRELVEYAQQKGIGMSANISIPSRQFYLNQNVMVQGSGIKEESIWLTLVDLINGLMTLANKLGANVSVNITAVTQGTPSYMRSQSFITSNNSMSYGQPNGYPSFTPQQPAFTPGMVHGFHPQNMQQTPYQPGYMGCSPFHPQGGPTMQGWKPQP